MQQKYNKKTNQYENITPLKRKQKSYLKNRWIFSIVAVLFICVIALLKVYSKQYVTEAEYIKARVVKVVDGDTIDVYTQGETVRVRMIGIDAPESVSSDEERNSVYGERASEFTKEYFEEGETVYLTFDKEKYDHYGRMLAYVWLENNFEDINFLYQYRILKEGYAVPFLYEPNTKYADFLQDAAIYSAERRLGLWAEQEFYDENKIY